MLIALSFKILDKFYMMSRTSTLLVILACFFGPPAFAARVNMEMVKNAKDSAVMRSRKQIPIPKDSEISQNVLSLGTFF